MTTFSLSDVVSAMESALIALTVPVYSAVVFSLPAPADYAASEEEAAETEPEEL